MHKSCPVFLTLCSCYLNCTNVEYSLKSPSIDDVTDCGIGAPLSKIRSEMMHTQQEAAESNRIGGTDASQRPSPSPSPFIRYSEGVVVSQPPVRTAKHNIDKERRALHRLEQAAASGDVQALSALGYSLYHCLHGALDQTRGLTLLEKAADLGNAAAQSFVGSLYISGRVKCIRHGVDDDDCAVHRQGSLYLVQAVAKGNIVAMHNLAVAYENGIGVRREMTRAYKLYSTAASRGHVESLVDTALCLLRGDGVDEDAEHALILLERAAHHGVALGYHYLALCTDRGIGREPDESLAITLYNKAAAMGCPESCAEMGMRYLFGNGVNVNRKTASDLLEIAANANNVNGMKFLGLLLTRGHDNEYKDMKRGVKLLQICADKGDVDSTAIYGLCLMHGIGGQKNETLGFQYIKSAADQCNANAMFFLARCYSEGIVVTRDDGMALTLYYKAAALGSAHAYHALGNIYRDGKNVKRDMTKAIEWFNKAASESIPEAQLSLALCYLNGDGVPRDEEMARKYFEMSGTDPSAIKAIKTRDDLYSNECPICLEPSHDDIDYVVLPCRHGLCHACAVSYFSSHYRKLSYAAAVGHSLPTCPLCRADIPHTCIQQCLSHSHIMRR